MKKGFPFYLFLNSCVFLLFASTTINAQTSQESLSAQEGATAVKDDTIKAPREQLRHFEPVPDRWESILPPSYPWYDPYNQNKLKGDYPIIGDKIFLVLTGTTDNLGEYSSAPTPSGISTERPISQDFFGKSQRFLFNERLFLTLELYKGNVAFKPRDLEFKVTAAYNFNYLDPLEFNNININVRKGGNRSDGHFALQELFVEKHLFDISKHYDFISLKAGIQKFGSDFRDFIFRDYNLGFRLLGSANNNTYQYNLIYLPLLEKDTNSELNTVFDKRKQDVFIANLYKQDFLTLGYTGQISFHYNHDKPSTHFDENGVPVRPAVIGNILTHDVKSYYFGWTGDGHFGRLNINHAFYQVLGKDSFNSVAGRNLNINAQMAALELSVDKDWQRYKISAFYASGDADPMDDTGKGFDSIIDEPFFAGGFFSYWQQQPIRLQGVLLTQKLSFLPNLRSNKFEGQSNFVNPGFFLVNVGYDAELTPKLKLLLNLNYLSFVHTETLEHFTNQNNIDAPIGFDYNLGIIYRPFLNNNAIIKLGAAALTPLEGFNDLFESPGTQYSFFTSLILTY